MRKAVVLALLVVLLGALAVAQGAPSQDGKLSKYIFVETERINPARFEIYSKMLAQVRQTMDDAKSGTYWLAMNPITGEGGTIGYVMFVDSLADVDNVLAEFDKVEHEVGAKDPTFTKNLYESIQGAHMGIMAFKPELSLKPHLVPAHDATRYRIVNVVVKPGQATRYANLLKEALALEKDLPGVNWITYQSVVHNRGTMFTIVTPLKGLADLDVDNSAVMAKIFTPLVMRDFEQRMSACIDSVDSGFYMVQPKLSRVPPAFVAANPSYWTIKEEPIVVAEKGKKAKKSAVVPAALTKEEKK